MQIDTATAERFLTALSSDASHSFQTFDDAKKGAKGLTRVVHGTFQSRAELLQSLNYKGAGVFVMVNRGDGYGRKSINVTGARALFLDLDGAPVEPVLAGPLRPRIVVESSQGKWHCYWPIADLPLNRFTDAQKALAARFDGDAKVHDKPRVMRLPGFLHNKAAPFQSRLVECNPGLLTWDEVAEAFGLVKVFTLPDRIPDGERNNTLFKLAVSAAGKGVPQTEQVKKAIKVNAEKCTTPLDLDEVRQIVASAYSRPAQGFARIPLAVLDGDGYMTLSDGARTLLLMAFRKGSGHNDVFPLVWSELRPWFGREKTFNGYRKELVGSGLVRVAIAAEPAMPRKGRGPKPTFYRLAIGAESALYSNHRIGAESALPEALQALGSGASNCPAGENGNFRAAGRAA